MSAALVAFFPLAGHLTSYARLKDDSEIERIGVPAPGPTDIRILGADSPADRAEDRLHARQVPEDWQVSDWYVTWKHLAIHDNADPQRNERLAHR